MSGSDDKDLELDQGEGLEFDSTETKVENKGDKTIGGGLDLDLDLNFNDPLLETSGSEPAPDLSMNDLNEDPLNEPPPMDELTMSTKVLDLPDLGSSEEFSLAGDDELDLLKSKQDSSIATRVQNLDDLKDQLSIDKTIGTAFSEEAMTKLREIDSLLDEDRHTSSQSLEDFGFELDSPSDESLIVPPKRDQPKNKNEFRDTSDVDLSSLMPEASQVEAATRITTLPKGFNSGPSTEGFEEVRGHYGSELERLGALITHLKNDRQDLIKKMEEMDKEKSLHHRQMLSLRADLDEKKVELTIARKKLGNEIEDQKLKLQIMEEKKALADEKLKIMQQELEKFQLGNRLDARKVSARERELEQKLELLKSDAETQIMHRDKMILDLKRKIDGMEFDLDTLNGQEKKSLASKVDLESKLDKAIKTLRSAITILESEENSRTPLLDKLKKNLDM